MLMHLERITSSDFYGEATAYLGTLRSLMEKAADERPSGHLPADK